MVLDDGRESCFQTNFESLVLPMPWLRSHGLCRLGIGLELKQVKYLASVLYVSL